MTTTNPKVDAYFETNTDWQQEKLQLRKLLLSCGLTEELKWAKPCYTFQGNNVVIIVGFKATCALLFSKGGLLEDPHGILVQPTKNTRAARQIRFTNAREILKKKAILREYILGAIELEKSGKKVDFKKDATLPIPDELEEAFVATPKLKTAFFALTPGRQRAYLYHFSSAKQAATRTSRIKKCMPKITAGKGFNER
jgi:uncharacterized protein YdeI (YjbR/CyaY-like superfamily)